MLTKAEILWTRRCPLKCSYCAMIDYDFAKAPTELMCEGANRLAALGCGFFAIYGSSPLWQDEFLGLPEFVRTAEQAGILTTVITDGIEKASKPRLALLYEAGLRSLTCSFDGTTEYPNDVHVDNMTRLKSGRGFDLVRWFASEFADLRDVELVATVTKRNWEELVRVVPLLSQLGIWFSFDFVHPDRGQPGTKCKGDAKGLRFEPTLNDKLMVAEFAAALLEAKSNGALVHQSDAYLLELVDRPETVTDFAWKCSRGKTFPAWVTIDADGSVLPCDDFWTDRSLKVWDLDEQTLAEFGAWYREEVEAKCAGCAWSTHWDAVRIADGHGDFDHYVHRRE